MAHHLVVGKRGEEIALSYLRSLGYPIRGCNVRLGRDEIDIIAYDPKDRVIAFVEVKTRSRASADYRRA